MAKTNSNDKQAKTIDDLLSMERNHSYDWELLDAPKEPLYFLQGLKDDVKDDAFTGGSETKVRPKVQYIIKRFEALITFTMPLAYLEM